MTMHRTSWLVVAACALSGLAMASCTLLAPTGTNTAPDAFPTPDATGLVSITHRRVSTETQTFSFEIQTDGTGTPPAAIRVDDSVNEDVVASFNITPLGLTPGVHKIFIFEGTDETPAAERVFVMPAPAADGAATP